MRKYRIAAIAAILFTTAFSATQSSAQDGAKPKGFAAVTKPSNEVDVTFDHPGRIVKMLVVEGDEVKENQLLAVQDDSEEQAALAIDKSKADDETTVHAQEAIRDQKQVDLKRKVDSGGTSPSEIDEAELDVKVETAKVEISKVQHDQDKLKYKQTSISVDKLKLYSPIDGVVSRLLLEKGDSADGGNMKAMHIVKLDPLWIDVAVPIVEARKLKEGTAAEITFADKARPGKVIKYPPVGDAASGTILVRVEVPNPEKLTSGEKVYVNFQPAASGVAAKP